MAFNPKKERDIARLRGAMHQGGKMLADFQERQGETVRQLVGKHYGKKGEGADQRVPVNFIEMAYNVYRRKLAARAPQASWSTQRDDLRPIAAKFQLHMNRVIKQVRLGKVLGQAVSNAILSIGIVKCALNGEDAPYSESINLDDFVVDPAARKWDEVAFIGNRFRIPLDDAKEMEGWDKDVQEQLAGSSKYTHYEDRPRLEAISRGEEVDPDEFEPHVELWEVYLPKQGQTLVMPHALPDKVLSVKDWFGSPNHHLGPYHVLGFEEIPNNLMPMSPINVIRDLHELANMLFNKLARQASHAKTVFEVEAGSESAAERIAGAADMSIVSVPVTGKVIDHKLSAFNNESFAFFLRLMHLTSYFGGNLELMAGLGAQSETLGQDELLAGAASERVADMQDQASLFAAELIRALGYFEWTDPNLDTEVFRTTQSGMTFPAQLSAYDLDGDWIDYDVDIVPYSMQALSPGQRAQQVIQLFNGLNQYLPLMVQQGIVPDFQKYVHTLCDLYGLWELKDILLFHGQPGQQVGGGQSPGMPANTTRTNVRVSKPGATQRGADDVLSRAAMGMGSQGAEQNAFSRLTGVA